MDISVLLALDTAAFERGLAAASAALGQFRSGADVCFEALGQVGQGLDTAAEAASSGAEAVSEAAEAASELAEAASDAAEAQARQADAAGDAGKALQGAAAAARMLPGPFAEVASGGLAAADAARKAGEAAKLFGVSMDAAMSATLVLALVAAVVKLVQTIREARKAAEELQKQTQQDNLAASVRSAAASYERLLEKMDAAAAKARGLSDAAAAGADIDRQRHLEEIERRRQLDILSGMDEGTANAKAESARNAATFGWERADSDAAIEAMRAELSQNEAKIAAAQAQQSRLVDLSKGQVGDAQAQTMAAAVELEKTIEGLRGASEVLKARMEAEGRRGALIDVKEQNAGLARDVEAKRRADAEAEAAAAAEEAARSAAAREAEKARREAEKEAARAAKEAERESARGTRSGANARSFSESPISFSGDRLARIGGFTGGSSTDQARRQTDLLSSIASVARRIADKLDSKSSNQGVLLT